MNQTVKSKPAAISTATPTTVLFKRGFRNSFIGGIHRIDPAMAKMPNMVGPADMLSDIPVRGEFARSRAEQKR